MAARTVVLTVGLSCHAPNCVGVEPVATEGSTPPFRGVVVLRDGGVLSGAIVRAGERYLVTTGSRELSVAASNVELVCGTIEDAYEQQRRAIQTPSVEAHLELADWCLYQHLMPQAARELMDARALDMRHPKLAMLERRLAVAREPRQDPAIVKAANVEVRPPVRQQENAPPTNGASKLRILASDLPDGAIERFTRRVQPVLVNSCATAGCHQMDGTQEFKLDRSLLHGMANRRSTTHNLQAVLVLVNRDRPAESPLLTVPRRRHGNMEEAVFGSHDAKLVQQLTEWVALVTYDEQRAAAAAEAARKEAALAAIAMGGVEGETGIAPQAVTQAHLLVPAKRRARPTAGRNAIVVKDAAQADATAEPALFEEGTTLRPAPQLRYGAQLHRDAPRDEFDPEIFNRRYGRGGAAAQ